MTVTASAMATLQEVSGGRMDIGMGRGDSARRVIGQKPVTVEHMEHACRFIKDMAEGREVDYEGTPLQLKWSEGHRLPVWVAAYGPKALRACGRVADGLIMQLADPFILEWSLGYVREGAEEAGRSFDDIQIQVAAPAYLSDDMAKARDQVRWFPALVSNHVVDLVKRYADADLPQELTDFIEARDHYDYAEHGRTGAEHADFVTDEVVDRFCVLGTADECIAKLRELEIVRRDAVQHLFDAGGSRARPGSSRGSGSTCCRRSARERNPTRRAEVLGTMTTVRAAVIQAHANMPKQDAIDKHVELIAKAAADGAEVTCLQEIFHGPYFCAEQDPKWYGDGRT